MTCTTNVLTVDSKSIVVTTLASVTTVTVNNPEHEVILVGTQGVAGVDGVNGTDADKHYAHVQSVAAATWTVNHGLNKYPSVTVVDSGNSVVIGEQTYIDANNSELTFSGSFSGKAFFN